MSIGFVSAVYVVAAILFILALGGLSNQEKAKRAIWYGIIGMALAVVATIGTPGVGAYWLIILMVIIGGIGGWFVANRVQMTQMPELVAGFHSLVGLAAVFIGINADLEMNAAIAAKGCRNPRSTLAGFAATIAKKSHRGTLHPQSGTVSRHSDRRHHLHRIGDRLRQTVRQAFVGRADPAVPPPDQPRRLYSLLPAGLACTWKAPVCGR